MVSGKDGNQEYQCQSLQILSRILFWFCFKELWGRLIHARMSAQSAELSKLLGLEWPGCEFFNYYYIYIYYYYYLVHVVAWTVALGLWASLYVNFPGEQEFLQAWQWETVMLVMSVVSSVPKQAFLLLFDWKRDWKIEGLIPRNSEGSLHLSGLSSKYYK